MEGSLLQTIAALTAVLAAVVLLRVLLQGLGFRATPLSKRTLRVVETAALGAKQRIHVVEVDGERLLLGSAEGGVRLIRRLPQPAAQPPQTQGPERAKRPTTPRAAGLLRLVTRIGLPVFAVGIGLALGVDARAADAPQISLSLDGFTEPDQLGSTLQIVLLLTLVSVAPSILLMATCFTRVLVVLALVRQATGIHQLPPNQVLVGLALFTTLFVMAPVAEEVHTASFEPYIARQIDERAAIEAGIAPVRNFLLDHTRENDLSLFASLRDGEIAEAPEEVSMLTLLPAFLISELRTAFEIGFMIYLPFLIIDIVIASMLISMGMIVLPPMMISLPFKLMLFVLLDGWNLVISSLVRGFA